MFIALEVLVASVQSLENPAFFLHGGVLPAKGEVICDHCNELAISRLALDVADRVTEKLLQHFDIAPVPCHFDGMAD